MGQIFWRANLFVWIRRGVDDDVTQCRIAILYSNFKNGVSESKIDTPAVKEVLFKWDHFERAKPIIK